MTSSQQAFPRLNTPFVEENRHIGIPWYRLLITLWDRSGGSNGGSTISSGMMMEWPGDPAAIPSGWLLCDGTAVSVSTYPDLFAIIGRKYGIGDGSSTFNLPNKINRVSIGAGGTYALAATGGAATIVLSVGNLPAHSHVVTDPGHNHVQDPHSHSQNVVNSGVDGVAGSRGATSANTTAVGTTGATTATNQSAVTGITLGNTGTGDAFSLLPPYLATYTMIKT